MTEPTHRNLHNFRHSFCAHFAKLPQTKYANHFKRNRGVVSRADHTLNAIDPIKITLKIFFRFRLKQIQRVAAKAIGANRYLTDIFAVWIGWQIG